MAISTTNHDEIRRWAEAKGGKPSAVKRTHQGGDVGIIRIMFPDNPQSAHDNLVEISWEEFFRQFDESELALVYEEDSLFSKIVGHDTLEKREHGEHSSRHHPRRSEEVRRTGHAAGAGDPHAEAGRGRQAGAGAASGDLKSREYRDESGNVHHHTRAYQEQHAGKK